MSKPYKPGSYTSVAPYLIVNGAQKMIDLLGAIFDASELRRYDMPDGTIMHAELKIDDSVVMLGDSSEEYPPNNSLIHVYVADARKTIERAAKAGCEIVEKPVNKEGDPDLRGSFRDFQGNIWAVGTQL